MSKETFRKERVETDNEVIRAAKDILGPVHYREFVKKNGPIENNPVVLEFVRFAMYENYHIQIQKESGLPAFQSALRDAYYENLINVISSELFHIVVLEQVNYETDIPLLLMKHIADKVNDTEFTENVYDLLGVMFKNKIDESEFNDSTYVKQVDLMKRLINCAIQSSISSVSYIAEHDRELIAEEDEDLSEIQLDIAAKGFCRMIGMMASHSRFKDGVSELFNNFVDNDDDCDEDEFNSFAVFKVFQDYLYEICHDMKEDYSSEE